MKTIRILLFTCSLISASVFGSDTELRRLIQERNEQSNYLTKLNDSLIPGRITKLYLLNDRMQKIILTDDSIIRHTESLIASESALSDSLRAEEQRAAKLSIEYEQLIIRSQNDAKMILIMKAAIAGLLVCVLILLYFAVFRRKPTKVISKEYKAELDLLQKENNTLQSQIANLQTKEYKINEEINRAVELKTASLQSQLIEANERNKSILSKIDKLIRDLSSVN